MADPQHLLLLPLWYVVFLLSLTCHEAAHAFAAHRGGDDTAYRAGQVSLNPIPHMRREPIGTVVVPLITYLQLGWMMGWASAPYDPYWEARFPRRAALMSAAGPLANLTLALVGFVVLRVGLATEMWTTPGIDIGIDRLVVAPPGGSGLLDGVSRLLSILLVLNLALFLFNLLPVPPMDGASVLAGLSAAGRRLRDRLYGTPFGPLLGLLIAWFLFPSLFRPVLHAVVRALYL